MPEVSIGYAAMLERFAPSEAVELATLAEASGFSGTAASDRFQPWTPAQGQSPFVWNVLTAIAGATNGNVGPGATTPSFRWHPAMIAQASATMAAMYPGRHWLGLGSGDAINEHITGQYWPEAPERVSRLFEAIDLIKKLFTASRSGKDARFKGNFYTLETTRLWTMPDEIPPILVATEGPVTARRAGRTVEGIITRGGSSDRLETLLQRFDQGTREAGKDPGDAIKAVQVHVSWAESQAVALGNALQEWPNGAMTFSKSDIRSPYEFQKLARLVQPQDFENSVHIAADLDSHVAELQRYIDLGFNRIYVHNVGRNQREWLTAYGREVLPRLNR